MLWCFIYAVQVTFNVFITLPPLDHLPIYSRVNQSYSMHRLHGADSPQQQTVSVSTHFCAVLNVAAYVRQI